MLGPWAAYCDLLGEVNREATGTQVGVLAGVLCERFLDISHPLNVTAGVYHAIQHSNFSKRCFDG